MEGFYKLRGMFEVGSSRGLLVQRIFGWIMILGGMFVILLGIPFSLILGFIGTSMIVVGLAISYLGYSIGFVWRREEVVDRWSVLIEDGRGHSEEVFKDTKSFIEGSEAPGIAVERREIAPTIVKGILGEKRDFLVVAPKGSPKLASYKNYICARDYGKNLDVSWYLTYRMGLFEAIFFTFSILISKGKYAYSPELDMFEEQDLRAYVTNVHHSLLKAVENLMLRLNQDPSKIDRRSSGFLGVS